MNFLAHCVLAGDDPDLIAGAIAGDFVKGVIRDDEWPGRLALGIRLHRRIDAFSNDDPGLRTSAARLGPDLRRIAPPIIDVWADHLLAQRLVSGELAAPGGEPFETYADKLAPVALLRNAAMPARCVEFLRHAERSRLFHDYATPERIERAITHLCLRLGREGEAPRVMDLIRAQRETLATDFAAYWPRLRAEAARFLRAAA
ncbi:MAG: ACP phosphodiesterase [Pseudomonadota bacterium]